MTTERDVGRPWGAGLVLFGAASAPASKTSPVGFAPPLYVDQQLAGSELDRRPDTVLLAEGLAKGDDPRLEKL